MRSGATPAGVSLRRVSLSAARATRERPESPIANGQHGRTGHPVATRECGTEEEVGPYRKSRWDHSVFRNEEEEEMEKAGQFVEGASGVSGASITFEFTDAGEPGKNGHAHIHIPVAPPRRPSRTATLLLGVAVAAASALILS